MNNKTFNCGKKRKQSLKSVCICQKTSADFLCWYCMYSKVNALCIYKLTYQGYLHQSHHTVSFTGFHKSVVCKCPKSHLFGNTDDHHGMVDSTSLPNYIYTASTVLEKMIGDANYIYYAIVLTSISVCPTWQCLMMGG